MAVLVVILLLIGTSTTTTALAKQQQHQQQWHDAIVVAPPRRALLFMESAPAVVPGVVSAVQGAGVVVVEGTKAVGTRIATAAANSGIGNGAIVEGARSAHQTISNAGSNAVGAVQNAGNAVWEAVGLPSW